MSDCLCTNPDVTSFLKQVVYNHPVLRFPHLHNGNNNNRTSLIRLTYIKCFILSKVLNS